MTLAPYELVAVDEARMGLIVLKSDESIERDLRRLLPDDVNLMVSRIPSGADVTPETLRQMELDLPQAASLFPDGLPLDVVAYGCTSGATVIGPDRVADLVTAHSGARQVTNPLSAALEAFAHLGVRRVGIVSPYAPDVAGALAEAFRAAGLEVPAAVCFGEPSESHVVRIAPASIAAAARSVAAEAPVDAVFMSCTNLRVLDLIDPLEAELGLPVLGSNLVLAWDMGRRAGTGLAATAPGRLAGAR
ncbi:maleate cis-trans isomerase family protein [Chachezhania sediminis]|uniref:maleate cis-trans isomerase family protein n=1 Tax=Chachezhania sediminis TaxID=2599291 RepID=UPI001E3CF477|nr:Asp/Glu racemase [Chachezhania sediminis]